MDRRKDIIKTINRISGRYSPYEVFSDWIRCSALSIQNAVDMFHGEIWRQREQEFLDTMKRYSEEEQQELSEMFGMLAETLDEGEEDILGAVFMESGMASKKTGQFFTPFHLSVLTAESAMAGTIRDYDGESRIEIYEPSSGGGGMIIAAAKVLREAGINYQQKMEVVAQDLDWKGVYMTYVQLSLLGIRAKVVQGDTLREPYDPKTTDRSRIMYTPAWMGALI